MTSVRTALGRRVEPAPFTALVALGDLACIAAFVLLGVTVGHESIDPAANPGRVAAVILTFAAGWAVTALLGGLYAADAYGSAKRAVARTVPAWVGAALIAQALRATAVVPGGAAVTFFVVSVLVTLALLVPWRVAVSVLASDG
ncbi:DUF3054 domain-containing protein [Halosimplex pelagicum]|uniref:DUF3054 domain-containing protein n=1 Tax=Halosimplex pelagicum TaxID=869886 RepID=A0A7D5P438_9EURY|nr:DUF3054 domain-containing protein [Halosimplex pelagicum]QLH80257.1 DUF3054 domain-containing protein [Halosimplex pelagicum]